VPYLFFPGTFTFLPIVVVGPWYMGLLIGVIGDVMQCTADELLPG